MNAINWFEIPATDLDRAAKFYETAFGVTLRREMFDGTLNAIFPYAEGSGVGGAVLVVEYAKPIGDGVVIYLNAVSPANLDAILARVAGAGGQVVMPKTDIGPVGVIGFFRDTEGNRIGLHAPHV